MYKATDSYVDLVAYFRLWDDTRNRLAAALGHAIHLEIEPGRYLVAESGYLVSEIRAVKQQGARWFYILDAGFNNLARPVLYGSYHPISIARNREIASGETVPATRDVIVGGPLCESGDIFTQEEGGFVSTRCLPEARIGDFAIIECAGAYGFVMGSNYNSKPLAAEVLVKNGVATLIRSRQTFEDLIRGEIIRK
jgi:diaminopimelate decarboxylase